MVKNAFHFILKALFVLRKNDLIRNISKVKVNFKIYDVTVCLTINICVPLPPTYVREVWDYQKANIENIKKAI